MKKPDRLIKEISEWWRYLGVRQTAGYASALAGIALTVFTATTKGPNQTLIAVIAVFAQAIAAFLFSGHGKAHPAYAKRSVERLLSLSARVINAEKLASASFESKTTTPSQRRDDMGVLSVELSWTAEGIRNAVADWVAFNEPLVQLVDKEQEEILNEANEAKAAIESGTQSEKNNNDKLNQAVETGDEAK